MFMKATNVQVYFQTYWEERNTSDEAPVGLDFLRNETARDNGLDTVFWLTRRPDVYQMEDGTKDTVVLTPASFELGLGTPDVNIDVIENFNVQEGDIVTAGDRSILADLPNRVAVVSTSEFFQLFLKIDVASNQIIEEIFDGPPPDDYAELYGVAKDLVGEAFTGMLVDDFLRDGELNSLVLFSYTDHINLRTGEDGRPEIFADTDAQVTVLDGIEADQAEVEAMLAQNGFETVLNKEATIAELVEFQAPAFVEADFLDPNFFPDGALDGLG